MSPEQATGDNRSVGPATDVYALGAVLYELLTGRAPFRGATVLDTLDQVRGQEAVPPVRLQPKTPRDANTICLKCLHKEPHRRYASAEELADDLRRFRAGETIRARATGPWEKTWRWGRRNPGWATVAVLLVLLASGATAFAWWLDRQAGERRLAAERAEAERLRIDGGRRAAEARAEVEQEFKGRQARQGIASNLKLAEELRKGYQFKAAAEALNQAAALATSGAPELRAEVERAQRDLAFVVRLDDIRFRKWAFVAETGGKGDFNWRIAAPEYRRAFADRGLDLTTLPPADAAGMIAASAIRAEVVAAVDDWALWETDPLRQRLLEVAVRADPGAWTDRLRAPELPEDRAALQKLAADADPRRLSPEALVVLAVLMERQNLDPVPLLTAARAAHPSRFELAFTLGRYLYGTRRRDRSAIGPYEAARALRPDNHIVWNNMGVLLNALGDGEGAVAVLRRAIELDENNARTHINLGVALFHKGDAQGAIAAFRRAVALDPKDAAAHTNLGVALRPEDLDAAVAAHKRAIELEPNYAMARVNLGTALFDIKDVTGAIAAFERAIELDPQFATAYTNLGVVLRPKELDRAITLHMKAIQLDPSNAAAYRNLGMALHSKGDSSGAIAAYTQVTELDPRSARAHFDLGNALRPKNVDGAIAAYSKATKLDPTYSQAFCNLGVALLDKNDVPGAIAALERAVELDPGDALALINLGQALRRNDLNRAVAVLMKATELAPGSEQAHFNLGCALFDKGEFVKAAAALTRTIQIEPKNAAAHTNLSVIYGMQRKFTDAISHARQAINADPKSSTSHAVLGELLLRTGDVTGARVAFVRAAELDKRWVPLLSKLPPVPVAPPPREVSRP
jgi:tetratricopeptide (TPR) repeat protein